MSYRAIADFREPASTVISRRWFCLSSSLMELRGLDSLTPVSARQMLSQLSYSPNKQQVYQSRAVTGNVQEAAFLRSLMSG